MFGKKKVRENKVVEFDVFRRFRCTGDMQVDEVMTRLFKRYRVIRWQVINKGADSYMVFAELGEK